MGGGGETEWHEVGRYDMGWRAFNAMIQHQMRALAKTEPNRYTSKRKRTSRRAA